MVTAEIKKVAVSDFLVVPNLNFCELCPVNHTRLKVKVIVDGVIVKFFQFDPFLLRKQVLVDPV